MSAPKSNVVYGLAAKIESTYGTYSTPSSSADGIQVAEYLEIERQYGFDGKRPAQPGNAGQQRRVPPQGATYRPAIKIEDKGPGVAYSASVFGKDYHALLLAGGMTGTLSGTTTWTYNPTLITAAPSSVSLAYYCRASTAGNSELWQANGVYTDWVYEVANAGPAMWTFNTFGRENAVPSETSFPTFTYTYGTIVPPVASPLALTINSVATLAIRSAKVEMKRTVQERFPDLNSTGAHGGFSPGERAPMFTFVCEAPLFATSNLWALHSAGTTFAASFGVGTVQYNKSAWTFAQAQVTEVKPSSDGPVPLLEVSCALYGSTPTANDDLVFTAS
jgi:hypothetical protein